MQPDQNNIIPEQVPPTEETPEMYTPTDAIAEGPETVVDTQTENDETSDKTIESTVDDEPVYWSAKEYIHHEKNGLWFVIFSLVVVAFISLDIFVIKSYFYSFSILVVVMAIAVIVYSRRPPRTMEYTLSGDQGLYVGDRLYHFGEFKAFGIIKDQGEHSIVMLPVKRFSPGLTVYFPEEAGEKIVDIFGARLPMQDLKLDFIDVIVRKLRL